MKTRNFSASTGLCLFLTVPLLASAQYRLEQFTIPDPSVAALQFSDGSLAWAMEVDGTTVLWRGDDSGDAQWTRALVDPGSDLQLVEGSGSSAFMIETYPATSEEVTSFEVFVTQRFRVTRISQEGTVIWSKQGEFSYQQPWEFTVFSQASLNSIATADDGLMVTLTHHTGGPSNCHLLRFEADGTLAWAERIGRPDIKGLTMSAVPVMSKGLMVTECGTGRFAVALDTDQPASFEIHTLDAQGAPLASRTIQYPPSSIYERATSFTTTHADELLIAGRISTWESANIMTYSLDEDLEFVDGDIYWGFSTTSSAELGAVASRTDGNRVLEVVSASLEPYTYLVEVDEGGDILNSMGSSALPYTEGRTLAVYPKHLLYKNDGIRLAHTLNMSHIGLGNLGHFCERSFVVPSSPDCYFTQASIEHIQMTDDFLATEPLDALEVSVLVPNISEGSPLVEHSLIGTLEGCQFQSGMTERRNIAGFGLLSNAISHGMGLQVMTNGPLDLKVFDQQGRAILNGVRLSGAGQWTVPLYELSAGVYYLAGLSSQNTQTAVQRFVLY